MNHAPAWQEYANDVLAEAELSLTELGALYVSRAHAWREGSIPDDEQRLARLLRVAPAEAAQILCVIRARTVPGEAGRLVFPDLERQRREHAEHRARQQAKANARWDAERKKNAGAHATASAPASAAEHAAAPAPVKPQDMPGECSSNSDLQSSISDLRTARSSKGARVDRARLLSEWEKRGLLQVDTGLREQLCQVAEEYACAAKRDATEVAIDAVTRAAAIFARWSEPKPPLPHLMLKHWDEIQAAMSGRQPARGPFLEQQGARAPMAPQPRTVRSKLLGPEYEECPLPVEKNEPMTEDVRRGLEELKRRLGEPQAEPVAERQR